LCPPPPPVFSLSKIVFTTLLAFSLVLSLALTACGGGGGGGGTGGDPTSIIYTGQDGTYSYKLTISKPRAVYNPAEGDDYELTVYEGTTGSGTVKVTSKGTINKINTTTFELTGTNITAKITITVDNQNHITSFEGTITMGDTTYTLPTVVSPITGGNNGGNTGGNNGNNTSGTWTAVADSTFGSTGLYSYIRAIAYGGDKFVAGGGGGNMAYSSDGVTWTAVPDSTFGTDEIHAIAFSGGKFVAGGSDGKMAYSPDGVNWTAIPNGTGAGTSTFDSQYIEAIAYGGAAGQEKFVAVGTWGKMAYSFDGINWTAISTTVFDYQSVGGTAINKGYINAIAYGNGKFVAGDSGGTAYSTDGISWTKSTIDTYGVNGIAYGSGKFVAVGDIAKTGYGGTMAYSSDGITWTPVPITTFEVPQYNEEVPINAIAYGNGKFVAVGDGRAAYSADGVNWTAITNTPLNGNQIHAIAYGSAGNRFVAGGWFGKMAYSTGF
jgi:hypothetical protein